MTQTADPTPCTHGQTICTVCGGQTYPALFKRDHGDTGHIHRYAEDWTDNVHQADPRPATEREHEAMQERFSAKVNES